MRILLYAGMMNSTIAYGVWLVTLINQIRRYKFRCHSMFLFSILD